MPYTRVWIHFVWSTKNRKPILDDEIRRFVFNHIISNAKEKGIYLDCINGYVDHVHCLITLKKTQSMSSVMHLIKGESAHWANKCGLIREGKLEWQDEYYASSVCESNLKIIRKYIWNQEAHHRKSSIIEEYDEFK